MRVNRAALDQDVAAREKRDENVVDRGILADHA
jgi:hypothetical protein